MDMINKNETFVDDQFSYTFMVDAFTYKPTCQHKYMYIQMLWFPILLLHGMYGVYMYVQI